MTTSYYKTVYILNIRYTLPVPRPLHTTRSPSHTIPHSYALAYKQFVYELSTPP